MVTSIFSGVPEVVIMAWFSHTIRSINLILTNGEKIVNGGLNTQLGLR